MDFRLTRPHSDNDEAAIGGVEEPRTIRAWAQARLGTSGGRLSLSAVLSGLPRRSGLRWDRVADSSLGGRIAPHLRHLDEDQARDLEARGQAFLDETEISDDDLHDAGPASDELTRLESAIDRR
jgi:hypothetical protein